MAEMTQILDSGDRTTFESGAVRDMQGEDKGRCDLMPLDVISRLLVLEGNCGGSPLYYLESFKKGRVPMDLYNALHIFINKAFNGHREEAMLELSIHFRDGAEKYGENNWQKGLPEWSYLSSAVRHYLKWRRHDMDERHDRAFMWNIVCLIWTVENIGPEEAEVDTRQADVLER